MVNKNLRDYLETVIDLEQNIKLSDGLIEDLKLKEQNSNGATFPCYEALQFPELKEPEKPQVENEQSHAETAEELKAKMSKTLLTDALTGLPVAVFFGWIIAINIGIPMILSVIGLEILWMLFAVIYENYRIHKAKKLEENKFNVEKQLNDYAQNKYQREMEKFNSEKRRRATEERDHYQRYLNEIETKKRQNQYIHDNLTQLEEQNNRSRNLLSEYYSTGIIHKDYIGDIAALCSFYDYIDKGICSHLEGTNQAYYLYRQELFAKELLGYERAQTMILDGIRNELTQVMANQQTLFNLVQENNNITNRIHQGIENTVNEIQSLGKQSKLQADELNKRIDVLTSTTAAAAYNTERIRKEIEYENRMNDFKKGRWVIL